MGIYLLNMKMPEEPTPITIYPDGRWMDFTDGRYGMLTEISPHGDLIERDELPISTAVPLDGKPYQYVHIDNIKGAPTIIPASEEGE